MCSSCFCKGKLGLRVPGLPRPLADMEAELQSHGPASHCPHEVAQLGGSSLCFPQDLPAMVREATLFKMEAEPISGSCEPTEGTDAGSWGTEGVAGGACC